MKYEKVVEGIFIERPNRFIAYVELDGRKEKVHVKNTGRCKELLREGVKVYLTHEEGKDRKTAYDLIAVEKEGRIINIDSQAPNKVLEEWLRDGNYFENLTLLRPETVYGESRLDFYLENGEQKVFIETKGVTLEEDGIVKFPDAPSERAIKHLRELKRAVSEGYEAYVIFVIQMEGAKYFCPNDKTHKEFADMLYEVSLSKVRVLAFDCHVTANEIHIRNEIPVRLGPKAFWDGAISIPLLKWYDKGHRKLPWRESPTPYRVWVSEIMLQQTRVEAVKPYYERFMNRLPDIQSLAEVEEEELLKLWEGLGYYNRAKNLQKAARQIMESYGGSMPDKYELLLSLSGIGNYTAGAIASIAFGERVPAVDGNVLRVISRLICMEEKIQDTKVKEKIERQLRQVMSKERPGDFNQAMMEIGATVCVPNGFPKCESCPLTQICQAYERKCQMDFPKKVEKKQRKIELKTILIIRDAEMIAIKKRENRGLLAGMYEFPTLEGHVNEKEVLDYCTKIGLNPLQIRSLENAKHIFSHKEWHMIGYMVRVDELEPRESCKETKDWLFVEPMTTQEKYPIPSAYLAYTNYLSIKIGNEKF